MDSLSRDDGVSDTLSKPTDVLTDKFTVSPSLSPQNSPVVSLRPPLTIRTCVCVCMLTVGLKFSPPWWDRPRTV